MRRWPFLFPLIVLLAGCSGGTTTTTPPPGGGGGVANPTWTQDVLPALQANCGLSGCHASTSSLRIVFSFNEGRTASSIYASLIDKPSNTPGWVYVKPGNPSQSWIYEKVSSSNPGGGFGGPMPPGGSFGSANTETLRNWIQQGATPQ